MSKKSILGVGSALIDVLAKVDEGFLKHIQGEKGGMELVSSEEQDDIISKLPTSPEYATGGAAGNTTFGLGKLGKSVAMLAKLGDDETGRMYSSELEKLGGSLDELIVTDLAATGRCISLITPDSERTMRTHLGASQLITTQDIKRVDFSKYELVYIEGYLLFLDGIVQEVMKKAKAAKCTIAIDLASFEVVRIFKDSLLEILEEYVDLVFANEEEAKELLGQDFNNDALAEKLSEICSIAGLKLGGEGSIIRQKDKIIYVPPIKVDAVDTTGAGDNWATGFLYGFLEGLSLESCGSIASLIGAETVKRTGAALPLESWDYIKQEIKKYTN